MSDKEDLQKEDAERLIQWGNACLETDFSPVVLISISTGDTATEVAVTHRFGHKFDLLVAVLEAALQAARNGPEVQWTSEAFTEAMKNRERS